VGRIDVWVNNAMATIFAPLQDIACDRLPARHGGDLPGAVWGTQAALRRMRARRGTIVQVGSALAYRSIPLQAPYCGAKAALRGFTDSLRCELAHDGSRVRVTMVQLSAFNTPQFEWGRTTLARRPRPMGSIFQPEIAARAIYGPPRTSARAVGGLAGGAGDPRHAADARLPRPLLGARAVKGQQSDEPLPPGTPGQPVGAGGGRARRARPLRRAGARSTGAGCRGRPATARSARAPGRSRARRATRS
jgi:hypothetical protein